MCPRGAREQGMYRRRYGSVDKGKLSRFGGGLRAFGRMGRLRHEARWGQHMCKTSRDGSVLSSWSMQRRRVAVPNRHVDGRLLARGGRRAGLVPRTLESPAALVRANRTNCPSHACTWA